MTKTPAPRRHLATSPFKAPVVLPIEDFALGDRVSHDQYGLGTVIGVEDGIATLVDFGPGRVRVLSPYKGMTKL
ncbi:hypothetical protein ACIRD2_03465 [Streptomyces sp. NPDC093595]|jgi:hypothetical protein|uniref:hypothetical protein n=1 Tax=unclassified Streptomyces TaxID=2593676 RepID=UPI0004CA662E|nr:hypothetical protein [Streptomyces sp. NRRL S-118]